MLLFFTSFEHFLSLVFLITVMLTFVNQYLLVSSICTFLMINDIEHFSQN